MLVAGAAPLRKEVGEVATRRSEEARRRACVAASVRPARRSEDT